MSKTDGEKQEESVSVGAEPLGGTKSSSAGVVSAMAKRILQHAFNPLILLLIQLACDQDFGVYH